MRKKGRPALSRARTRLRILALAATAIAMIGTYTTAAQAAPSSDLIKQINAMSNKLENVTESYNKLNDQLKQTVAQEKALTASLPGARQALSAASTQMRTIASTAYMQGNPGGMTAVLDGPGDLIQRMSYLDQIQRDRQRAIDTYTSTLNDYQSREAALKTAELKQTAQAKVIAATKTDIEGQLKVLMAKRTAAYGRPSEPATTHSLSAPSASGSAGTAVRYAINAYNRGATYVFAASGPDHYDCSGLTMAAWAAAGVSLPHNAAAQYGAIPHISRSSLAPGDLVFYRGLEHVGIYIGGGRIIAATRPGEPLKNEAVDVMPPYGYGRP